MKKQMFNNPLKDVNGGGVTSSKCQIVKLTNLHSVLRQVLFLDKLPLLLMAVFLMTACKKPILDDEGYSDDYGEEVVDPDAPAKKFTFTVKGDFTSEWKSMRGYLQADGKDMTDLWVLDYMDDVLIQQVHQSDNTAEDFGRPTMNLAYGSHHVYFIASRGSGATLNTDAHTLSFAKVLDTFYKDYEVSVVATSNGNRAVTLDRCVTRLRLTFEDAVDENTATINFTPHTWYYGWDYVAGTPTASATDQTVSVNVPTSELGKTGLQANLFGFSTATEWTTDIAINSKTSGGTVIGSATITNAPFKANRISEYSGPLFSSNGSLSLSLNGTWDDAYNGVW